MLVYLSNAENVKGSPNQNFARELMELFTLGVGNYTEGDVEASARAWTGHNADWPDVRVPVLPDSARQRDEDVLRHDQELERPRHHRRDPGEQRRQASRSRRGSSPRSCGSSSPTPARRPQCSTRSPRCSLPTSAHRTQPGAVDPQPSRVLQQRRRSRVWCARRSSTSSPCATTRGITSDDLGVVVAGRVRRATDVPTPQRRRLEAERLLAEHQRAGRPRRLRPVDDVVAAQSPGGRSPTTT